ncbi:MAG: hypothetical protein WC683_12990 [bacterium]
MRNKQVQEQVDEKAEDKRPFIAFWEDMVGGLRGQPHLVKLHTKEELIHWAESHRDRSEEKLSYTRQAFKREATQHAIDFFNKLLAYVRKLKSCAALTEKPLNLAAMLSAYQAEHVRRTPDVLNREPVPKGGRNVEPPDLSILEPQADTQRRRPAAQEEPPAVEPTAALPETAEDDELGEE